MAREYEIRRLETLETELSRLSHSWNPLDDCCIPNRDQRIEGLRAEIEAASARLRELLGE